MRYILHCLFKFHLLTYSSTFRWDAEAERRLRSLDGHTARVGALSWNQHWLSSGGRDSQIVQHDVRSRNHIVSTYVGHTQEVRDANGIVILLHFQCHCYLIKHYSISFAGLWTEME
jgi:WD40 repeat protein